MTRVGEAAGDLAPCSALTFGLSPSWRHRAATAVAGVTPGRPLGQLVRGTAAL